MAEMAQMAVEASAQWLVLAPGSDFSDFRETGLEIATLCREAGILLTIEGNADQARELGLHGVFVPAGQSAVAFREALGPEAIVGTEVSSAESALAMERADIDYIVLPSDMLPEAVSALIAEARAAGCSLPFVADVHNPLHADLRSLLDCGYAGFIASDGLFEQGDPVENISQILELLA